MIIADENIHSRLISALRAIPIEVISVRELYSGIQDSEVIEFSKNPPRIILTEDKDFGEWVFAHHVIDISVVFLRYNYSDLEVIIEKVISLIRNNSEQLLGKFTTVTKEKIRSRAI